MPRLKKEAWAHFKETRTDEGKDIAECKYCNTTYTSPNATRLSSHLLRCSVAPDTVKAVINISESKFSFLTPRCMSWSYFECVQAFYSHVHVCNLQGRMQERMMISQLMSWQITQKPSHLSVHLLTVPRPHLVKIKTVVLWPLKGSNIIWFIS